MAAGPAVPAPVPRTGQTTTYSGGDDGELEIGVEWPSPRFTINESSPGVPDGTVTDNLTGLIWLQKANCIDTDYPAFDSDNTAGDGRVFWQSALTFVTGVNAGTYSDCAAGQSDWRLPNNRELLSLIDRAQSSPALPSGHPFSDVVAQNYWSSTTASTTSLLGWTVSFFAGHVGAFNKTSDSHYVWPVRGGE